MAASIGWEVVFCITKMTIVILSLQCAIIRIHSHYYRITLASLGFLGRPMEGAYVMFAYLLQPEVLLALLFSSCVAVKLEAIVCVSKELQFSIVTELETMVNLNNGVLEHTILIRDVKNT